nr:uncharacterized protein LOC100455491 isoform X2 [Pongo abelii]
MPSPPTKLLLQRRGLLAIEPPTSRYLKPPQGTHGPRSPAPLPPAGARGVLKSGRHELRGNSTGRARACKMRINEYEIRATARQRREGLERAGVQGVPPWAPQRHLLPFPAPSRPPSASADATHADHSRARRTPGLRRPSRPATHTPRRGWGLGWGLWRRRSRV